MGWIALAMLALQAGVSIYDAWSQSQKIQQQNEYQSTNLKIQQQHENYRLQQEYYNTEADISTLKDKLTDAFANIKILFNNIDVVKHNAGIKISQLQEADKKQAGMILSAGYSNGFMLSETQELIKNRNSENINQDIETTAQNEANAESDIKTQIQSTQSFIERYYGSNWTNLLTDTNKDNKIDINDIQGMDVSKLDFSGATGYLSELTDRLNQMRTQLQKTGLFKNDNIWHTYTMTDPATGETYTLHNKLSQYEIDLSHIKQPFTSSPISVSGSLSSIFNSNSTIPTKTAAKNIKIAKPKRLDFSFV